MTLLEVAGRSIEVRAAADEMTVEVAQDGLEVRSERWGDMHVARYALPPGTDLSPFFAMLPDGLCSGEHFGVVLEGEITVRYRDGSEEATGAGEVYHWPAGHTGWTERGVVFVAITPLAQVEDMERRMTAAG